MDGAALEFGLLPSIHGKLLLILFAFATYTMSSHRYLFGQSVYRTGAREHLSGSVYIRSPMLPLSSSFPQNNSYVLITKN